MIVSVQLRNGVDAPLFIPPNTWTTITGYGKINGDYSPTWLDRLSFGEIWPAPTSVDLDVIAKLDWPDISDYGGTHTALRLARDPLAVFRDPLTPVNTTGTDRRYVGPDMSEAPVGLADWQVWSYLLTGRHTEPLALQVWHNAVMAVPLLGAEFKARALPAWPTS